MKNLPSYIYLGVNAEQCSLICPLAYRFALKELKEIYFEPIRLENPKPSNLDTVKGEHGTWTSGAKVGQMNSNTKALYR